MHGDVLHSGDVRGNGGATSVASAIRVHRVLLGGLLLAIVLCLLASGVQAMSPAHCHTGDACHAPEPVCMQSAPALPGRLASVPSTPAAARPRVAVRPPPLLHRLAGHVTLPAPRATDDLYLLTSRLRR